MIEGGKMDPEMLFFLNPKAVFRGDLFVSEREPWPLRQGSPTPFWNNFQYSISNSNCQTLKVILYFLSAIFFSVTVKQELATAVFSLIYDPFGQGKKVLLI